MIYTEHPENFPVVVNIGRPDIFNEKDAIFWKYIHQYLKETLIELKVNNAFYFVDEILSEQNPGYGGGGFKYYFWFKSNEDAQAFLDYYKQTFEEIYNKKMSYGIGNPAPKELYDKLVKADESNAQRLKYWKREYTFIE